ncbi:isopenicillin N-epimerase [Achlya hypogyna]|uniref:Isopenicillin N-epimerase n=1 Tax=Achlya hypogyna TaxID=1202772 RepID=A0A1V9YH53_ACHHY|nr:isopenicillin N-epimerase [Achlya hypogyna]
MPLPDVEHADYFAQVEELLHQDERSYVPPPPVEFDEDLVTFQRPAGVDYGHRLKALLFTLDPAIAMLNHGSYGACAKPVLAVRSAYLALQEFEPVKFFSELGPRLVRVLRILAAYLGVAPAHISLVPNASAGTTMVLRSLPLTASHHVVSFDLGYNAVNKQIEHVCAASGARHVVVRTSPPYTHARIIDAFEQVLRTIECIGVVVVDHITSSTGIIMPIEDIILLCRSRQIPVLVDGAHAIGQVPIDLASLQPDFYVSNLHKWLLAPKSSAFLYIRDAARKSVRVQPTTVSHGYGLGYGAELGYLGTLDYSAWLAVPAALAFHTAMGGASLARRNHDVCVAAASAVAAAWGTSLLVEDTRLFGSFCVVVLPARLFPFPLSDTQKLRHGLTSLHHVLRAEYAIEAMCMLCAEATPGIRIAVQMYNEPADYAQLTAAVLDIIARTDIVVEP